MAEQNKLECQSPFLLNYILLVTYFFSLTLLILGIDVRFSFFILSLLALPKLRVFFKGGLFAKLVYPWHFPSILVLLTLALVFARALILLPLSWDALMYHLPKATYWLQHGIFNPFIAPGAWASYEHFFGGAEIYFAAIMSLTKDESLIPIFEALLWLGSALNIFYLGKLYHVPSNSSWRAVGLTLIHPIASLLTGVAFVESAIIYFLTAALFHANYYAKSGNQSASRYLTLLNLGILASIKLTALPVAAVIYLSYFYRVTLKEHMVNLSTIALPLSPWLLKNWLFTGGIFSPFAIKVFGISLGSEAPIIGAVKNLATTTFDFYSALTHLFALNGIQYQLNP
jgi:hypothetical protein